MKPTTNHTDKTVVVNYKFRIAPELRDKIKAEAEKDDRSQNYIVHKVLKEWAKLSKKGKSHDRS